MTHTTAIAEVEKRLALGAGRNLVNPVFRRCIDCLLMWTENYSLLQFQLKRPIQNQSTKSD